MAERRGRKRPVGRPKTAERRRNNTKQKADRRTRLRAFGLVPIEVWVKPGELDDLLADSRLRVAELELLYAIREGDEKTVVARREHLNARRVNMGLKPIKQGELERFKAGERDVRDLAKGVHPDQLERVTVPTYLRGAVTNTPLPMKYTPPDHRPHFPAYMVIDPYNS